MSRRMRVRRCGWFATALIGAMAFLGLAGAQPVVAPCRIEVVERGSGWPVPLVELRTTHELRFVTDNAGLIAMDAPELVGRETWFDVRSPGYEVAKDGFGNRGVRLTPQPGQTLRVEVDRTSIAKRLGRLTGAGLYAESQQLGERFDWRDPPLVGCDSVQMARHGDRLFWLWGDTTLYRYPLGVFDATSATTPLAPIRTLQPPLQLSYDLFVDERGHPRGVAPMPGPGPTWLGGYVSLPDTEGREHLVATYSKIAPPMDAYEYGLCVWNDEAEVFEPLRVLWERDRNQPKPALPEGHASFWADEQGQAWVLFGNPLPTLRCPATFEAWQNPTTWEELNPQQTLRAAPDGGAVRPHSGSIAWSPWRKRWVTVFMQEFGKPSAFGELWYAEADSPFGPWETAVKVLSHPNYTFYNPRIHPELTPADSPVLLFEGTYTSTFADNPQPTPRYNYNQILYRLDLDDPALRPAR